MPLQEEKTHVPHVGNFHVRCAPEMTGLEKFLIEQDARRAARRV
jgi:hypothetical protein